MKLNSPLCCNFAKRLYSVVILSFSLLLLTGNVFSITIGSDTTVGAAQSHYTFISSENSTNRVANYALMLSGFSLDDLVTTCSFDSVFPLSGTLNLNGGSLFLNNDFFCNNTFGFGSGGTIYGNGHSIEFPASETNIMIPLFSSGQLALQSSNAIGDLVRSVGWSFDDKYIAIGMDSFASGAEIEVYYFDKATTTLKDSVELGRDVNSLEWHPNEYYLAVGKSRGGAVVNELIIYSFSAITETLTEVDGFNLATPDQVFSIAWSSDGAYLAVGIRTDTATNDRIDIYSFSAGSLSVSPVATAIITDVTSLIQREAISWKSTGDYVVVGTSGGAGISNLHVYSFSGAALTLDVPLSQNTVRGVSWRPDSSLILVGLNGSTERLRIYEHSAGSLLEVTSAQVGESTTVISVDWSDDGNYVLVGKGVSGGKDVNSYYYDDKNRKLFLLDGYDTANNVHSARWSSDAQYVALGEGVVNTSGLFSVLRLDKKTILFDDVTLVLNSDINLTYSFLFRNNCKINGKGNRISLSDYVKLQVIGNGQLKIENADLVGLNKNNLSCSENNASLILQDIKLTLSSDFEFNKGSILFRGDVSISGTSKFIYTTSMGSTIDSNSILYFDKGTTFSYAPIIDNRNLLYMSDITSNLYLDGCTLSSTKTGIRLSRGTLFIDNLVTLSAQGSFVSESICFGDGNILNDLNIVLLGGAHLDLYGRLEYENTT